MKKTERPCLHRIAAGGFVTNFRKILLVRYRDGESTYLVAPGGGIKDGESFASAAEREVEEETAVKCKARTPIMIENIRATRYQMVKVWYHVNMSVGHHLSQSALRKRGSSKSTGTLMMNCAMRRCSQKSYRH
jgi:8-oxo-dGTP pyrophosphatase MutT (NUDIX family)